MINSIIDTFINLDENNQSKLLKYANVIINPIKIYLLFILILLFTNIILNLNINKLLNKMNNNLIQIIVNNKF